MIVLEGFGELLEVFGGSRSGQEGSMSTKCCTFLSLPGGRGFPKSGSRNAPGDAPGSLACVSNDYCLMFREPLVFRGACSGPPRPEVGGISLS